jgi:hypothetical protein
LTKRFGIHTIRTSISELDPEKKAIYTGALDVFDEVLLIDSRHVGYSFYRGEQKPRIMYQNQDISDLEGVCIRGTSGYELSVSVLAQCLFLNGCKLLDPMERFLINQASKVGSTIDRFVRGVGTTSFLTFDKQSTVSVFQEAVNRNMYPLIIKPVKGKQGRGISLIKEFVSDPGIVGTEWKAEKYELPMLIQPYIEFSHEFRVLVVNGQSLGVVEKFKPHPDVYTANAAQGATFVQVQRQDIEAFVLQHVSNQGILGVDVGVGPNKEIHIIEENRAPVWQEFERITKINVAAEILKRYLCYHYGKKPVFL